MRPRIADVIAATADVSGLRVEDITGACTFRTVTRWRQLAIFMASDAGHSSRAMGKLFRRSHKNVLCNVDRAKEKISSQEETRRDLQLIRAALLYRAMINGGLKEK